MDYGKKIIRLPLVVCFICVLTATFILVAPVAIGQSKDPLEWPSVSAEQKPCTYWWWMGNAVNEKDLEALLNEYNKVGLGGTKIVPIYGAKGYEDQYIDFLTPKWMNMLAFTAKISDKLGMTIDLDATCGWNMGGPWVRFKDAAKRVVLEKYTLKGGQKLQLPVKHIQEPYTNLKQQPREPISANSLLHMENLYVVRYRKDLPLLSLMAYSDKGKIIDLTEKVDKDGTLHWTAPAGDWKLYGIFLGSSGTTVERAAPGGVGWQIDYLSKDPVIRQMKQFEDAFSQAGYEIKDLIRSFHDDSFEQYTDWTKDLFDEFIKLHGYDLRNHLPALFGEGDEETVIRVKSDYRETVSHLIIHEHTIPWTEWANERGVITINQAAHGAPAHPLDNWAAGDQPENTSASYLRHGGPARPDVNWMMASSAAHVTGKRIISQETATFLRGHFNSSLADAKNGEIDKVFLNGTNKIYYHSTTYSPPEAKWPGWLYYAPAHFVPANTIWKDFPALNNYVSRISSFLQTGDPDNDILIYYPVYDIWAAEQRWIRYPGLPDSFLSFATSLSDKGYTFDYISDKQIADTKCKDGQLITSGGNDYHVLLFPSVKYLPVETLSHVLDLAEEGATVIFCEGLPQDVPGFGRLKTQQQTFQKLLDRLINLQKGNNIKGKIIVINGNVEKVLDTETSVAKEPMAEDGLKFVRRSYKNGIHYFIKNTNDFEISKFVPLSGEVKSVAIFDPMRDENGMAAIRKNKQGKTEVFLQLQPEETCILRTFYNEVEAPGWKYIKELPKSEKISDWEVSFIEGGPTIPSGFRTDEPIPWTQKEGEEFEWFSGTAQYCASFNMPVDSEADEWILDLGEVYHSARVEVNGQHVATLITPPFKTNITEMLQQGRNELKIEVTSLAANRIRYMERNGIEHPEFYNINISFGAYGRLGDPREWSVMKSGLEGPVQLIPAKYIAHQKQVPERVLKDHSYGPHWRNTLDFWKAESDKLELECLLSSGKDVNIETKINWLKNHFKF